MLSAIFIIVFIMGDAQARPRQICNSSLQAVDVAIAVSSSQWTCMFNAGYSLAAIRAYRGTGNGSVDETAAANIEAATAAGIGVIPYHYPSMLKDAETQFLEVFTYLGPIDAIYLDVEIGLWDSNQQVNRDFISRYNDVANSNGVAVGLYTSSADYAAIVGEWMGPETVLAIWYVGDNQPNFSDFVPFGRWTVAQAKQYAQNQQVCGVNVDLDIVCQDEKHAKFF